MTKDLINSAPYGERPANLRGADLRPAIDAEVLEEALELHGLWCAGDPDGERLDLSGVGLSCADLRAANMAGAVLSRAYMEYAELRAANMAGAVLSRANLEDADMEGAILSGANLAGAILEGANLAGAILEGAILSGAKGNGREVKSMQIHKWSIVWTQAVVWIGCKSFTHEEFRNLTPERAEEIHRGGGAFCRRYKQTILNLVEQE